MDLFKAIFENSDSEDSDQAASDKDETPISVPPAATAVLSQVPANIAAASSNANEASLAVTSHVTQDEGVGLSATNPAFDVVENGTYPENLFTPISMASLKIGALISTVETLKKSNAILNGNRFCKWIETFDICPHPLART